MGLKDRLSSGNPLRTSTFRRLGVVGLLLVSVFFAESAVVAFIMLLLLFGIWNGIYLFIVPRTRFVGGIMLLLLGVLVLGIGTIANWIAALGGVLFVQANWLVFIAAARLDE